MWSQRNNNNYEQTALLISLDYFNDNSKLFLKNFYLKSKRSIAQAKQRRAGGLRFSGRRSASGRSGRTCCALLQGTGMRDSSRDCALHGHDEGKKATGDSLARREHRRPMQARTPPKSAQFPAGSYIVRMDQPYSRIADALLDYQYWSPRRSADDQFTTTRPGPLANWATCRSCAC